MIVELSLMLNGAEIQVSPRNEDSREFVMSGDISLIDAMLDISREWRVPEIRFRVTACEYRYFAIGQVLVEI